MKTLFSNFVLSIFIAASNANDEHRLKQWNFTGKQTILRVANSAEISASPTLLDDGDAVTIKYSLSSDANGLASYGSLFVASFSPSTVDITKTAPVEFYALQQGSYAGSLTFAAVNMRGDYVYILFNGSLSSPSEISRSNTVTFNNLNAPLRSRLMHTQVDTEMMVSWSSARSDLNPVLFYQEVGHSYSIDSDKNLSKELNMLRADVLSSTWSASDLCGAPATTVGWRDPGYIHTTTMTNLHPGSRYIYRFGDDSEMSGFKIFQQPSNSYPYSFVTYADEGQATTDGASIEEEFPPAPQTAARTLQFISPLLSASPARLVIHHGDISYARGYAADWDIFNAMNSEIFSRVPYAVSMGNHEADWPDSSTYQNGTDSGGECGVPAQRQFPMPQPGFNQPWYYFRSGPLFVLMFSTEHDFREGSEQYLYIQRAMTLVDRRVTPWVVVAGHRPMYIDSMNDNPVNGDLTVAAELQKYIEPLLMNAGGPGRPVDITLWGHHHSYQRMCASYSNQCMQHSEKDSMGRVVYKSPGYPIPLVIGTGGAGYSTNVQHPQPEWCEFVDFDHGVAQVTIHNATALEWRFVKGSTGKEVDSFWIMK